MIEKRTWNHKNPHSERFAIPLIPDSVQNKKLKAQEKCSHPKYSVICGCCQKTLGSELTYSDIPHVHEKEIML